jgi:thymidylate kinase
MVNFVVLIGPDGIGKSSTSKDMKTKLESSRKYSKVRVYHHRPEILPNLSQIIESKKIEEKNIRTKNKIRSDEANNNTIISTIKILYYCLDYMFVYFQVLRAKLLGELVIYDRYAYDYSIQKHHVENSNSSVIFLLYKILPKPDKIVFIYSNPKVVISRKNELPLNEHIAQNSRCIRLLRRFRNKALPIHTTSNLDLTTDKILSGIL